MIRSDALPPLPGQPPGMESSPTFREPWQARAFALVVILNRSGRLGWSQWTELLGSELSAGTGSGDDAYYRAWMRALEKALTELGITDSDAAGELAGLWQRAALNTPHGKPIKLENA